MKKPDCCGNCRYCLYYEDDEHCDAYYACCRTYPITRILETEEVLENCPLKENVPHRLRSKENGRESKSKSKAK